VFEDIGVVAGVKGVTVTEHGFFQTAQVWQRVMIVPLPESFLSLISQNFRSPATGNVAGSRCVKIAKLRPTLEDCVKQYVQEKMFEVVKKVFPDVVKE
jgi:hypothetical protein